MAFQLEYINQWDTKKHYAEDNSLLLNTNYYSESKINILE